MPTYDYACSACGQRFEVVHNMGAPGPTECPVCHAQGKVDRLISSSCGFQLLGTGWYATDYKSRASAPSSASSSSSSGGD